MIEWIAFDADDTLWHSECYYREAQNRFLEVLAPYFPDGAQALDVLHRIEISNLPDFGYGFKGFGFSIIEAAVELTGGSIPGSEIQKLIDLTREIMHHEVRLLDYAEEAVRSLAASHPLMMITKGDLMDQERKIHGSGLRNFFQTIEIVSDKTPAVYEALLRKHRVHPEHFLMVGNSMKSDVLPVVSLGGYGVYVPYSLTWAHEVVKELPGDMSRVYELEHLGLLPPLVAELSRSE